MTSPEHPTPTPTAKAYRYTIGGDAYGVPHDAGDRVPSTVPQSKLAEWLAAGVIEAVPNQPTRTKETTMK